MEKWASTSRASSPRSINQELQAHPWCHKRIRWITIRTPPSVRCLRCKASTRDSIGTHLFQEAPQTTIKAVAPQATLLNNSKIHKVSRVMPRISMVMGRPSIRVDMTSRFLTTKSSRWRGVWSVRKAATWRESSRSVARTCLSHRKSSNWDFEERVQDLRKGRSRRSRRNHSIFASVPDSIPSTWQPAARSSNFSWTSTKSTRSTVRGRGVTSSQSTQVASFKSRSTRLSPDVGLRFSLFLTPTLKTRLPLQLSDSKGLYLRTTRCSSNSSTSLIAATTSYPAFISLEMAAPWTRWRCQEWHSRCPSTGQSCRCRDHRTINSSSNSNSIRPAPATSWWTWCPSDLTRQPFHISKIKQLIPQILTLLRQVAWVECV